MKPIEEQTYYEILEVEPNATAKEIQKAYEHAKETFDDESVAIYSLFTEEEIRKIQIVIEEAYRALLEEALKRSSDPSYVQMPDKKKWEKPSELGRDPKEGPDIRGVKESKASPAPLDDISGSVGGATYRGKTLRQIRENMNIDLQALSGETKINPKILESIEEEDRKKLPPRVYLKGFLRSYAQSLGLDPIKVTQEYLRFLDEDRTK